MRNAKVKITIGCLLLFSSLYAYTLWEFWEPSHFTKGSFAYFTKVPEDVKSIGVLNPKSQVTYDFHMADGLKNQLIIQRYTTENSYLEFTQFFNSSGFECRFDAVIACKKKGDELLIVAEFYADKAAPEATNRVEVVFTFLN